MIDDVVVEKGGADGKPTAIDGAGRERAPTLAVLHVPHVGDVGERVAVDPGEGLAHRVEQVIDVTTIEGVVEYALQNRFRRTDGLAERALDQRSERSLGADPWSQMRPGQTVAGMTVEQDVGILGDALVEVERRKCRVCEAG